MVPALTGAERVAIGLTGTRATIDAVAVAADSPEAPLVLLVGGLDGSPATGEIVARELRQFEAATQRRFRLLAIPLANPDKARLVFPPDGSAYRDNPESHYLWRWIAVQAPDLVLIAGPDDCGLAQALARDAVAGMGRIPARSGALASVPDEIPRSEAHAELERRWARSPRATAEDLARYYGHDLDDPVYIPAVALIGRIRLGQVAEVERIVAPYRDGSKDGLAKPNATHLAGHLVFGALAERTGNARYVELVRRAAGLGFAESGEMKEAMPFHNEMSDAVFMGCPILAKAGKLTSERKYFDMALRHFRFMQQLCLRADGIYRHSPLAETAWGRGNAFPALGLALTLADTPRDHPAFGEMLRAFQSHMAALARWQGEDGMWREVVDQPGAYAEFSATAMIATAMLRGLRQGWIEEPAYRPRVARAWRGVTARIGAEGRLLDVCESTGKQKSLEDYLRRVAIFDRDPRGGAMALLFATEMAGL